MRQKLVLFHNSLSDSVLHSSISSFKDKVNNWNFCNSVLNPKAFWMKGESSSNKNVEIILSSYSFLVLTVEDKL